MGLAETLYKGSGSGLRLGGQVSSGFNLLADLNGAVLADKGDFASEVGPTVLRTRGQNGSRLTAEGAMANDRIRDTRTGAVVG